MKARALRIGVAQRRIRGQGAQRGGNGFGVQAHGGQSEHALAGVEDRPVAGAAAQIARELVGELLARGRRACGAVALVATRQRHHEARGAETALRTMAIDHRLLRRVQRSTLALRQRLQVLHRQQRPAVERGQELDAGVDRAQAQPANLRGAGRRRTDGIGLARQLGHDHRAGAAIALGAAFLAAAAMRVLAQPVEHGVRGGGALHRHQCAAVEEADRALGCGRLCHGGSARRRGCRVSGHTPTIRRSARLSIR